MLDIEIGKLENSGIVKIKGELDIATAEKFKEAVDKAKVDTTGVILDFNGLEFLDSTGVGALLHVIREFQEKGLEIKVINIINDVYEVLDLLGIPELVGEDKFEVIN